MEQKRKRRTHAEVVAAREAYAKERHDKLVAREAKKAEREKLIAERAARRKMTSEERRKAKYKQQRDLVEKRRKGCEEVSGPTYATYEGPVNVGDVVAARFAGSTVVGVLEEIDDGKDQGFEFRKGVAAVILYNIRGNDGYLYPVRREKIFHKLKSVSDNSGETDQ